MKAGSLKSAHLTQPEVRVSDDDSDSKQSVGTTTVKVNQSWTVGNVNKKIYSGTHALGEETSL